MPEPPEEKKPITNKDKLGKGKEIEEEQPAATKAKPQDEEAQEAQVKEAQLSNPGEQQAITALKNLGISQTPNMKGKTPQDMESYKFWQTQPVPRFGDTVEKPDGEIKKVDPDKVPKEPRELLEGFTWVTMDLDKAAEITEVYELLNGHYVEDDAAQFRLSYSASFFNWALKAPGWKKDWHVGVRATKSKKLIAFISAIPVQIRIREQKFTASEVNFLCIHKKLRSKRLAPILIEEITRRSNLVGVFQGLYTGGQVLPKPLSSCRYFHRAIDWNKLYECGFAGLPAGSTKQRQLTRTFIPSTTALSGFRSMQRKDIPAVHDLLTRYMDKFSFAPEFSLDEIEHWLYYDPKQSTDDQMVWGYVVEHNGKITDFMTFYRLDSSIIGNNKHDNIKAAYLYYYASETAFLDDGGKTLKERLNALVLDTLVMAKKVSSILHYRETSTNMYSYHSTCATLYHCWIIHSSSHNRNSAQETVSFTTIYTTTAPPQYPEE